MHSEVGQVGERPECDPLSVLYPQVFLPALSFNQHKTDSGCRALPLEMPQFSEYEVDLPKMPGEYNSVQLIRDEFLMNIQKFSGNIQRTMQQLEGRWYLWWPACPRGLRASPLSYAPTPGPF